MSIYPFILSFDLLNERIIRSYETEQVLEQEAREIVTEEDRKDYLQRLAEAKNERVNLTEDVSTWYDDLKKSHKWLYDQFDPTTELSAIDIFDMVRWNKRERHALLYDILIEGNVEYLDRYLQRITLSEEDLQKFIIKNDIYTRLDLIPSTLYVRTNDVHSIEMVHALTDKFSDECDLITLFYKVNDLKGAEAFIKKGHCHVYHLVSCVRYAHDMRAYNHIRSLTRYLGYDPEEESGEEYLLYLSYALNNKNPEVPIGIMEEFYVTKLTDTDVRDIYEIASETLEYLIDNKIELDWDKLLDAHDVVLTSPPSEKLQKFIKSLDLSTTISYNVN